MAIELNTDGNTQTSTTGNTGTSTTGDTVFDTFGKHTESVQGSLLGWYLAFTRIVTGVAIDMVGGISINIFAGHKFVIQDGKCTTVGKLTDTKVMKTVMQDFEAQIAKITDRYQIIENCTNDYTTLTQTVGSKISNYNEEEKNGDNSTEEWTAEKNIMSASYSLTCKESAVISVMGAVLKLNSGGTYINGKIIELA